VCLHGGLVILSPSTDVLPEFLQKNNSLNAVVVTDTNSSHSCVAKAGWGARLQWRNINGDIISESNTNLSKSAYVTYSITNTSTMLTVNNPNYAVDDPIYRVYPVHNATIHYPAENNTFFCVITGVNEDFLKQYNVSNLKYSLTVQVNSSSSLSSSFVFSTGSIAGSVIGAVLILIIIVLIIMHFCYVKYQQRSKHNTFSAQSPFSQFTAELGIGSKCIGEKVQFPREKVVLIFF